RILEGRGLSSPELSVLLAWSKIALTDDLMATSVDTDGWALDALAEYFPPDLQARYGDRLGEHPLRKEIIVTMLANDIVNHGGITFVHRVVRSEEHTSELQSRENLVCRLLLEKKKKRKEQKSTH